MAAVEMQVQHVTLDPVLGAPVVVLKEKQGSRSIPIWIGQGEAASILSELNQVSMARPSSHDLMKELISRLRGSVSHITVTDVRGGTFFAEVSLHTPEGALSVDSRPSDAIALALRAQSPIYVEQSVMERAWGSELASPVPCDVETPRALMLARTDGSDGVLEGLQEDDFGKWKM
jgi:bifunctional DNase/RNase